MACCAAMHIASVFTAAAAVFALACGGAAAPAAPATPAAAADPWARAHELIDLFDLARFGRDDSALMRLSAELTGDSQTIQRGEAGTARALERLLIEVDEVLRADRLHPGAVAARTLLEFDTAPASRSEVWRRMMELKAIARSESPLAGNARLRLAGHCVQALRDAGEAPLRHRVRIASHCLYPLYDSDPEPYFAEAPEARPPAPSWTRVEEDLRALLAPGPGWQRLEPARAAVARTVAVPGSIPRDPPVSALPLVAEAELLDGTPAIAPGNVDRAALQAEVQADGRGRGHAVVDPADPQATARLLEAARTGSRAGVAELEMLVATEQRVKVPPGDHWSGRLTEDTAVRAAVIPLALAPLGGADLAERSPRLLDWTVGLRLHLVIGGDRWRLLAPGGEIASAAISEDTHAAGVLIQALERVRRAFPDEQNLILVLEPAARYPVVAQLAAAATRRGGAPLFRLGLAEKAPPVRERKLALRIARRAAAAVAIVPETLARRAGAALGCYRDLVERTPTLAGTVRLELQAGAVRAVRGADPRLSRCATSALADDMVKAGTASAEITFTVESP